MSSLDRRLRQIIAKYGGLEADTLESAAATALGKKTTILEVLADQGAVDPSVVLGWMSLEAGVPPINLDKVEAEEDITDVFPEELAKKYGVAPLTRLGPCLTVAMADPFDIVKLDQIRIETHMEVRPVVALPGQVADTIKRLYEAGNAEMADLLDGIDDDDIQVKDLNAQETVDLQETDATPAVKLVNGLIYQGIRERVSDIHIEPFEKTIRVRFRQDGVCREVLSPPKNLQSAIASRIKIMCGLDIAERRKPQDGKFQVKVEGRQVDFRVSTLPMVHGEKIVLRILDGGNLALSLDTLGFEQKCLDDYRHAIRQPYGMILITGPTGSGKSTTLYSALKEIYSDEINFVTVEDPVEYQLEGVNQVPVNPKRELTFSAALRSILRQDPDVIMIGEIRDKETIEIAVKAALTGHLVLSTLHTNDAPSAVTRMVDMGLDPFLVSSSTLLICAQRLCRKLCEFCRTPVEDVKKDRLLDIGFLEQDFTDMQLFQAGPGCPRCSGGYKGRFAILETLPMSDSLRRLIVNGASSLDIKDQAVKEDMITLRRAAVLNALRGRTSVEEVLRVTIKD